MTEILKLESLPRIYGVKNGPPILHSEIIDSLKLCEVFSKRDDINVTAYVGDYKVVIESEVDSIDKLKEHSKRVKHYTEILDKVWTYVAAYPFTITDYSQYKFEVVGSTPIGWTSNHKTVERALTDKSNFLIGDFSLSNGNSWIVFHELPLRAACKLIRKYDSLSDSESYLIDLHYLFLTTEHQSRSLFLLAKALEIIEAMVEGKNREKKSKFIEELVGERLSMNFSDLIRLANTSREIRHVVREKSSNPKLHPSLGEVGVGEFMKNANTVIRCMICYRLDTPFNLVKRK